MDIVILDDHKMFSITFSLYLKESGEVNTVKIFDQTSDFLDFLRSGFISDPVIILDYYIPNTDIIQVIRQINEILVSCKIIILTSLTSQMLIKELMSCRLAGIISKADSPMEFIYCVKNFKKNRTYLSAAIQNILKEALFDPIKAAFTRKEMELLRLLSEGKTVEVISNELNLSKHTVITHRRNILAKSDFHSIADLIVFCIKSGIL